ncbi:MULTISPECIES: IS110 family transposase [unclassified Candidatus Tisiphia]|jgi:transposase|uniref:IS110 family transposase n=1 Tax=unclassified Candidatus Tisiphia TaxID=2996318 RepID=UPI001E78B520|nr:MAG: transposase [Rickettsia endosymbiont of Cimex lectularius]
MATTYIGVDVSKKTLSIYMLATNKAFEVTNDQHGFTTMLSTINKYYPVLSELIVVFEPTGGYEYNLREFLKINKLPFATVHPNKVRSYAKAKGWLAKTDNIDSKLLHESIFAGRGNLRRVLYNMAAVAALRCNKCLRNFYDHLIAKHKPAKVALVAVMRKLLAFMHSIVKNNSSWNENLC